MKSESRRSTKRTRLVAERARMGMSLAKVAELIAVDINTLSRWERGITKPHRSNLARLCKLYGATAVELGMEDEPVGDKTGESFIAPDSPLLQEDKANAEYIVTSFLAEYPLLSYLKIVLNWPRQNTRYHELQRLIMQETEGYRKVHQDDNSTITRREALRTLALLPIQMCGLSALGAVLTHPITEILTHCAAGLTACTELINIGDINRVDAVLKSYLPSLIRIVQQSSELREEAASLTIQSYLLSSAVVEHQGNIHKMKEYCHSALKYSNYVNNKNLQAAVLIRLSVAYDLDDAPLKALQTYQQAIPYIKQISPMLRGRLYAGLAGKSANCGDTQQAARYLDLAHTNFPQSPEKDPYFPYVYVDPYQLLLWEGITRKHLGQYEKALQVFETVGKLQPEPQLLERMRIEFLTYSSEAALNMRDLEKCCTYLQAAGEGAIALGHEHRLAEARLSYSRAKVVWPNEPFVKSLQDLFLR